MATRRSFVKCALFFFVIAVAGKPLTNDNTARSPRALIDLIEELEKETWMQIGQSTLQHQLSKVPNVSVAKNVIMFLGDGMSVATVSAARILLGQRNGYTGEDSSLYFEKFPYTGLSKTYCVDKQVADSACSATAYLGGVKANLATIGVTAAVKRKDCKASTNAANHVPSISVWAQNAGKSTGFVTTTRVTHASPAGTFSHTAERDWEADSDIIKDGQDPKMCPDIASQLIYGEPGRNHKVIMGGGRKNFLPKNILDEDQLPGVRADGVDLLRVWEQDKIKRGAKSVYVSDRDSLLAVKNVDYLLGLFDSDHMQYHLDADPKTEPTLAEMTRAAIEVLQNNTNGYFLFVEGGRIDQGHHDNLAHKALDETIEFAEAVQMADSMVGSDTLILITADHAHTMAFAGYPNRGTDILGFGGTGKDGWPYSTLTYANGPSYRIRYNMTDDDRHAANYTFPSAAPLDSETHGGDDVQVFAKGPWSHIFTGSYEQNAIPHMMAFASCIGPGFTACS